MDTKENIEKEKIWQAIKDHKKAIESFHLREFFTEDADRADNFSIRTDELFIDFSRNRINRETVELLLSLAKAVNLKRHISDMLDGKIVNVSEKRPALHTALRRPPGQPLEVDGINISSGVDAELERMKQFVNHFHSGKLLGSTGKPLKKVINIGIGGSDLGPRLIVDALYEYRTPGIEVEFAANLDANDMFRILDDTDPETCLFIVTSKSFSTLETLTNAQTARRWLISNGCTDINKHFVAISSNGEAATEFGISEEKIYAMWDWVGGRYSVWSSVGLPVAIYLGMDKFMRLLSGAHAMDLHFRNSPYEKNIPVMLGMLDVWYNNFFGAESIAVVPYDQRLKLLPEYLSQLVMESNGKRVDENGNPLPYHTSPVIWGSIGTNAQHAFFQMLHQGTRLVPVDFLLPVNSIHQENHHKFVANCFAQGKALMLGKENPDEPHRDFPGNRPSTTIVYDNLTPGVLGMILAMYEHRTYVQARVWGINPFDQWGVELGKTLATEIIDELEGKGADTEHDASTKKLIAYYKKHRTK